MKLRLLTLIIALAATAASGQSRVMTLRECVEEGIANSPAMRASRLGVEKARLMQGTAFDPAPTEVEFAQETTSGSSPDNGFTITQEFDFPTLYVARHKALRAATAVEQAALDAEMSRYVGEIEQTYYTMLYARHLVGRRESLDSVYRDFSRIAEARFRQGESSRLEQINARRLCESNALMLDRARADYRNACAAMRSLIGADSDVEPAVEPFGVIRHEMPAGEVEYDATPAARLAASRLDLGRRNLSVARQGYIPSLSLGVTTQCVIKSFNPYDVDREPFRPGNFMGFSVGVKVPLFFGATRARVRTARNEVATLQEDSRRQRAELESAYSAALEDYRTARRAVDYYESEGLAGAREIARLSKVSYDLSEITYTEHIQNLEAAATVELEYADAVDTLNRSIIKLKTLQGK